MDSMGATLPKNDLDWSAVSVVVPVFNGEKTLTYCIDALLAQTYPAARVELIFVNDGSTDASAEILARYDARLRVLDQNHKGASAARNTGIKWARHEIVAFTDADCVPDSQWLAELITGAEANPQADFVGGRVVAFRPTSLVECYTETLFDQEPAIKGDPPYMLSGNVVARRNFLIRVGLFDEAFPQAHDVELSFRGFFNHQAKFVYIESAVVAHWHCRTLGELFRKGLKHGRGSAQVQDKYASELRLRRPGQWFRTQRHIFIYVNLWKSVTRTLRRLFGGHPFSKSQCVYPFYEAVFNLGKEMGFVRAKVKSAASSSKP